MIAYGCVHLTWEPHYGKANSQASGPWDERAGGGALQERAAVEEGRRERSGHWSGRTKCTAFVGTKRTRVSEEERRKSQAAAGGSRGDLFQVLNLVF